MKRLLKLLARLYPADWQKRYGAEFDALLDDTKPRALDAFDIFREALSMQMRNSVFVTVALCALAGLLVATAISFTTPVHYESQTLVIATPGNESISDLIDRLNRTAFTRDSLASIIREQNLYPSERANRPLDEAIDRMQKDIHLHSGNRDFTVQFDYPDPHLAQAIAMALTSRVIETNLDAAMNGLPHSTLSVPNIPSLPTKPVGLNRVQSASLGLLSGLCCGLFLVTLKKSNSPLER